MTAQTITHTGSEKTLPSVFSDNFLLLHFCGPAAGNTNLCEVFPGNSIGNMGYRTTWHRCHPNEILQLGGTGGTTSSVALHMGKAGMQRGMLGLKMWLVRDNEGDGRQLKRRKVTI